MAELIDGKYELYDVSYYQTIMFDENGKKLPLVEQKHIDFRKLKKEGNAAAVILKAGQHNYLDPAFRVGWENARLAELLRASYWFCDKDDTPENQARLYWDTMKNDPGEGFLAGDLEWGSWTDVNAWDKYYRFLNELQQRSGYPDNKIVLYTNFWFWKEYALRYMTSASQDWFAKYPLWLAQYRPDLAGVSIPPKWTSILLWQDGTPSIGLRVGVWSREIDHNWWLAGSEAFRKTFGRLPNFDDSPVEIPEAVFPYEIRYKNGLYRFSDS